MLIKTDCRSNHANMATDITDKDMKKVGEEAMEIGTIETDILFDSIEGQTIQNGKFKIGSFVDSGQYG